MDSMIQPSILDWKYPLPSSLLFRNEAEPVAGTPLLAGTNGLEEAVATGGGTEANATDGAVGEDVVVQDTMVEPPNDEDDEDEDDEGCVEDCPTVPFIPAGVLLIPDPDSIDCVMRLYRLPPPLPPPPALLCRRYIRAASGIASVRWRHILSFGPNRRIAEETRHRRTFPSLRCRCGVVNHKDRENEESVGTEKK
ncbi:hypothetical protein ZHAS_00000643 [Anopheles sinensis]|uniref:Uncharacterized protein n=1 Tax=Anopheles sinensis TaxID=74873 RepID=A0A084VAE7_ANOSI|nr:hypothetical protein ZHAS_00000643 [Anopheles sinensis]